MSDPNLSFVLIFAILMSLFVAGFITNTHLNANSATHFCKPRMPMVH